MIVELKLLKIGLNYYSDEKNKARMGQYDTLTNDSKNCSYGLSCCWIR